TVFSSSIRGRLLLLILFVALLVAVASAVYSSYSSGRVLKDQLLKRGSYITQNLAENSAFAVMAEDKEALRGLLDSVLRASGGADSDVVGALIRDTKGVVMAQTG